MTKAHYVYLCHAWSPTGAVPLVHADGLNELIFVVEPRQNYFFVELIDALRVELDALAVETAVSTGGFPPMAPGRSYCVVSPHEWFLLAGDHKHPSTDQFARTIAICLEQPDTAHFEVNWQLAPGAGAVFDINQRSVAELRRRGVAARHLQIGYTRAWDHTGGDLARDRDIDVLFLGSWSDRRALHLGSYASHLHRFRSHLVVSDNSRPNLAAGPSFVTGSQHWDLLARSKVLLNLHQGPEPYFEWLRVAQAAVNGCVVVSEHSTATDPFHAGVHFVSGRPEALGLLAQAVLEDAELRSRVQREAYDLLRTQVRLARAAEDLADAATALAGGGYERMSSTVFEVTPPSPARFDRLPGAFWEWQPTSLVGDPDQSVLRRALKDTRLELIDLRRRIEALGGAQDEASVTECARSASYTAARPVVTVIITLYNYAAHIETALASIAGSRFREVEAVVVDDASADQSADLARRFIRSHPRLPALLISHSRNRGLPSARNSGLDLARGEYVFILDADNEVLPDGIGRLVAALDADDGASFAYGMQEQFGPGGPVGLGSWHPWVPERLRAGNYIDAMALIRRDALRALGGYSLDRRLYGWEDYDLWCRFAEAGHRGAFLAEIIGRYRVSGHSMISLTDLSTTTAFSVLAERYPAVMGAIDPPL